MLIQTVDLKEGDTLVAVGLVTELVRRKGWVRVTVQPEAGTPICFDLPSHLGIVTDRPIVVKVEEPWKRQKTNPTPQPVKNPTPIPVTQKPPHSAASLRIGAEREARHGISDPGL